MSGRRVGFAGYDPCGLGTFATGSICLGTTCHTPIILFDGDALDDAESIDSRDSLLHQLRKLA